MLRVELVRHGATAYQGQGRYQGSSDVPLSSEGRRALVPAERRVGCVRVSPLARAVETARIVFPGAELAVVDDLREMDFGVFEGRTADEMEHDPAYRAWVAGGCEGRCPGGDDRSGFCARVCAGFSGLVDEALEEGDPELVVVAHGGTLMAALEAFAEPARPYFSWHVACGEGFVLDAAPWQQRRRLKLVGPVSYTAPSGAGGPEGRP